MFWLLVLAAVLVVLLAPLRRAFFSNSNWRLTVPVVASLAIGYVLGSFLVGFGLPGYVLLLGPAAAVVVMAPVLRGWLDENFRPRNDRGDREQGTGR